ncbi:hypothetical protein RRG08_033305 [Elysia crispata]|uniref:Uncharacterized protein n=1 Tax=Elysia crispata TaxID=231223 RepID=A0AAE1CKM2_9GAST|nr:hypothetical protein RRG08_033305 [Elysia crispata]
MERPAEIFFALSEDLNILNINILSAGIIFCGGGEKFGVEELERHGEVNNHTGVSLNILHFSAAMLADLRLSSALEMLSSKVIYRKFKMIPPFRGRAGSLVF